MSFKKICNDAGIKLITFYTKYPNEKQYVLNRIKEELEKTNILLRILMVPYSFY